MSYQLDVFLAATALVCYAAYAISRWYLAQGGKGTGASSADKEGLSKEQPRMPPPRPDTTLTPETLDGHSARDHIFANKTIRYPYFQTMAHQPMLPEHWIEPDHFYRADLAYKKQLVETQGAVVCDTLPCVDEACGELLELLSQWLVTRYPRLFQWIEPGRIIHNLVTEERLDLYNPNGQLKSGTSALRVVSGLVQDDFLIAAPLQDGSWICAGGLVAFPGFYLLSDKIGLSLHDTHSPVPDFNEKLLKSVERSFTRMAADKPFERTSWGFTEPDDDLFWTPLAGPLPLHVGKNGARAQPVRPCHLQGRAPEAAQTEDASKLLLRLDHQTFVKMPRTGVIFFGVHPMRRPLSALEHSPLLPQLLLKIHQDSADRFLKYKDAPSYQNSVLPYLESLHRKQLESGVITEEDAADPASFRRFNDEAALDT
ncbi:hypothetical protein BDZ90DRAFT_229882, partial [Jaminaea rosea]